MPRLDGFVNGVNKLLNKCRSDSVCYVRMIRHRSVHDLTMAARLKGEIRCVYREYFREIWPCYDGILLQMEQKSRYLVG